MTYDWNKSLNKKNPFSFPIIHWRGKKKKRKGENKWTEQLKGNRKKPSSCSPDSYLTTPGGWTLPRILADTSRCRGMSQEWLRRSRRVLQQPQGTRALSSVGAFIKGEWRSAAGERTPHSSRPRSPSHAGTGQSAAGAREQEKAEGGCCFSQPLNYKTEESIFSFRFFFSPSITITQT